MGYPGAASLTSSWFGRTRMRAVSHRCSPRSRRDVCGGSLVVLRESARGAAIALFVATALACGSGDDNSTLAPILGDATAPADALADVTPEAAPTDATGTNDRQFTASLDGSLIPPWDGSLLSDPCNGDPAVCDLTYDKASYAASHAAMAYSFPPFACPAQRLTVRQQLDLQIRALGFEAHLAHSVIDGGSPLAFCMGDCAAGELRIDVALGDVAAFLAVNPREIVTLLIEGGADGPTLATAITAAGLDTYALARSASDPWPTVQAMIAAGTRVVVFADVTGTAPPWMLPLWDYVAETGTEFTTPQSMTCDVTRGASGAPLYLLDHFLLDGEGGSGATLDTGLDAGADSALDTGADAASLGAGAPLAAGCDDPTLAHRVNGEPFFTNRVTACTQQHGSKPTFVAVDDVDDGDLSSVIRALNRQP
jgi:hypothetical protein